MVVPGGSTLAADQVLDRIRAGHGARHVEIWIENPVLLRADEATMTARYEEWQQADADPVGRISTVVFARDVSQPHGLRWLTVHETWLPAQRP